MGLSYKADIDDLRESPALEIFHELEKSGSHVMAVEPNLESMLNYLAIKLSFY